MLGLVLCQVRHKTLFGHSDTISKYRVTTFLENLNMSESFAVVREMSGNWLFVTECP